MTALTVEELTVSYNGHRVVDSFDLSLHRGEWVMVLGPNGAGKSSIIRALSGQLSYKGRIQVEGREVASMLRRELARLVAVVPQAPVIPEGMTVYEYVGLGRTPHLGWFAAPGKVDEGVVESALSRLELYELRSRWISRLSGGERQRAVIARALTQEPAILLLDEPTTALDVGHQQAVLELIDRLRHDGLAILSAMHDLNSATQFADSVVLLKDGTIIVSGAPGDVIDAGTIQSLYGANIRVIREGDATFVVAVRK